MRCVKQYTVTHSESHTAKAQWVFSEAENTAIHVVAIVMRRSASHFILMSIYRTREELINLQNVLTGLGKEENVQANKQYLSPG